MELNNFIPTPTATKALVPSGTSQSIAVTTDGYQGGAFLVYNASNKDAAFLFGATAPTAVLPVAAGAAGDMVCPSGGWLIVNVPAGTLFVACIASGAGAGNIYFTPGQGS